MQEEIASKLSRLKETVPSARERVAGLTIDYCGRLLLDGEEIPYYLLQTTFEALSLHKIIYNKSNAAKRTAYHIDLGQDRLLLNKFDNGNFEYLLNGTLHCASGPAARYGETSKYYYRGALHNLSGPAIDSPTEKLYYIDGKSVSLIDWIERNPDATYAHGTRGERDFSITKTPRYAVVKGLDGTVALLEKSDEEPNVDDFLLELVAARVPGYKVIKYEKLGFNLNPVYNYIKNDLSDWRVGFYKDTSRIAYSNPDGSRAILSLSKKTHILSYKTKLPTREFFSCTTDFGFDPDFQKGRQFFPGAIIHRDTLKRLHRLDGPAVNIENVLKSYYINGSMLSEEEHSNSSKLYSSAETISKDYIDLWKQESYLTNNNNKTENRELINLSEKSMPTYTNVNLKDDRQTKFEEALKRVKVRKASAVTYEGERMEVKTLKHGEAKATTADSRFRQVASGTKLGLQKAALRIGSQKAAEKIVETASPTDNVVVQRIVQLALLLGTAELAERLPDGAASKVGLNEERRQGYGGLARYVAGETLGRDAVDIVSFVAPMLLENLQGISAEDITDLTQDAEEVERLEAQTQAQR